MLDEVLMPVIVFFELAARLAWILLERVGYLPPVLNCLLQHVKKHTVEKGRVLSLSVACANHIHHPSEVV